MELRPVRAETFDAAELKKVERPQSAINTTRALVKCFNKLLWFAAEVEDALDVKGTKITLLLICDLKFKLFRDRLQKPPTLPFWN